VCDTKAHAITDPRDFELVEQTLRCALEDERFDFLPVIEKAKRQSHKRSAPAIEFPTRIAMDNKTHPIYTLIEIQAPDRLGLLFHILHVLSELELDVNFARINTDKGAAIDTFYLTDKNRNKLEDVELIEQIRLRLKEKVEELNKPYR
jgi:[protein-PII] uridylyltransferase